MVLLHDSWAPENRAFLSELIGRTYSRPPIAVFDWDNTCIRGDIAEAVFHHLAADLTFHFDHPHFWDWATEVSPLDFLSAAFEDYSRHPNPDTRLELRLSFERARKAYYEGMDDGAACAWDAGVFLGWRVDAARDYCRQVIAAELAHPLTVEVFESNGERLEIPRGLRMRPAMRELVDHLQRAGWQVWVLSASARWIVEPFAERYGIPPERVVGMRRAIADGILCNDIEPPISFSDGKLDAYQMFIDYHQPPWLAVCDSVYDWKLLEWAEGARILIEPTHPTLRTYALWQKSLGLPWMIQLINDE